VQFDHTRVQLDILRFMMEIEIDYYY